MDIQKSEQSITQYTAVQGEVLVSTGGWVSRSHVVLFGVHLLHEVTNVLLQVFNPLSHLVQCEGGAPQSREIMNGTCTVS